MDIIYVFHMVIKYSNIFHSKALQNLPRLGFWVWKKYHLATLVRSENIENSQRALRSELPDGFIFKPNIPIWVNYVGSCNKRCWSILWLIGLSYGHFVYFVAIWYVFPRFGLLYLEKSGNPGSAAHFLLTFCSQTTQIYSTANIEIPLDLHFSCVYRERCHKYSPGGIFCRIVTLGIILKDECLQLEGPLSKASLQCMPGLPDFSWYNICTKTGKNVPNCRKIYQMTIKYTK
jgi:hypothetical protein